MSQQAVAFLSYVRFDDEHENGRITQFCERLSGEVRMQTGEKFHIFQDRNAIAWGQQWKKCIGESLDAVTFFIPVITPGFFKSPPCREELDQFLQREKTLHRSDLILPVYYLECPILSDETKREKDHLAKAIAARQYADWRGLRFEPFTSPVVGKTLATMAAQIVESLARGQSAPSLSASAKSGVVPASPPLRTQPPADPLRERDFAAAGERIRGPAPKTEPPTRVVDALCRGDHTTLTEALEAAKPGDRILVRPGLYREGLVIDKPVEIVGDGERREIVIEAAGRAVVLFRANMGLIANLTLRQTGAGKWYAGGGRSYCVDIAQGRLELEGCDITSQSLACVAIHGGADPKLRRNRIHDGKQSGVFVYENGRGTLEDNDIFANAHAGVAIETGGDPTLRRNSIHDGERWGVHIYEKGQGTLEDNNIFANGDAGVEIKTGGNPTLRRNRIHDGKRCGISVCDQGEGTLEDNDIFANAYGGVNIHSAGNPTLRLNRIHDEKGIGVHVQLNGKGTLEDNEIYANIHAGVEITSAANPTLRRNRIHDGKAMGVYVHGQGQGMLEGNVIVDNADVGVAISLGGNPTLRRNQISGNGKHAVWISYQGGGAFLNNDLRGNTCGAWDIAPDCESNVRRSGNRES